MFAFSLPIWVAFPAVILAVVSGSLIGLGYAQFAGALAGMVVLATLYVLNPALALMTFVCTRPIVDAFVRVQIGSFTVGQLWGGLLVGLLLVEALRVRSYESRHVKVAVIPVLFLILYALTALARPELNLALANLLRLASWILLVPAVEQIASSREGQRLVVNAGYVFAFMVLVAIAYAWTSGSYGEVVGGYVYSTGEGQGPHGLSFMALYALPIVLAYPVANKRSLSSSVLALCLMGAAIMSFVRTTVVVLAILALVYVACVVRWKNVRGFLTATVGAAIVSGIAWTYREVFVARFEDFTALAAGSPLTGAGSGRIAIWGSVVEGSTQSVWTFLVGSGAAASSAFVSAATNMRVGAHNDFLDLLATGGVFLAFSYVLLLAWMGKSFFDLIRGTGQSRYARRFAVLGIAGVLGLVVVSVINGAMFYQANLLVAMSVGLSRGMSKTPGETFLDRREP